MIWYSLVRCNLFFYCLPEDILKINAFNFSLRLDMMLPSTGLPDSYYYYPVSYMNKETKNWVQIYIDMSSGWHIEKMYVPHGDERKMTAECKVFRYTVYIVPTYVPSFERIFTVSYDCSKEGERVLLEILPGAHQQSPYEEISIWRMYSKYAVQQTCRCKNCVLCARQCICIILSMVLRKTFP